MHTAMKALGIGAKGDYPMALEDLLLLKD